MRHGPSSGETLDLSSPRAYFEAALAMLAVYLRVAGPDDDRRVLRRLVGFRLRIVGLRDRDVVRVFQRWVEGQLEARRGTSTRPSSAWTAYVVNCSSAVLCGRRWPSPWTWR